MRQILTAYGHSWIDSAGDPFPELFVAERSATALKLHINNAGKAGSISTETAADLCAQPPAHSAVFLLMTGLNDLRYFGDSHGAAKDYEHALGCIFQAFDTANARARVVAIAQPHLVDYTSYPPANHGSDALIDRYNRLLLESAGRWPHVTIAVPRAWDPQLMLDSDGVHPNRQGHAYLASVVLKSLAPTLSSGID